MQKEIQELSKMQADISAFQKQQAAAEEAALVHVTTVEDPVQLTYCNGTDTLAFTKEGDDWKSEDTPDFPLDSTFLETIVTAAIGVCSIVGLTAFLILCF
mgnify:CR=1 FL=1